MATRIETRPASEPFDELLVLLNRTTNLRTVEVVADQLGATHDERAIRPLLLRLGDHSVQEHRNVEGAVCRALMALGVMGCSDDRFILRPRRDLADGVVATIRELAGTIPWQYFGTPRF